MKKVVLFLPPYSGPPMGPPAGLLSLASPLRRNGYETSIIDAAVVPDYLPALESATADALCLGISLLTGPMILGAIKAAIRVKQAHPGLPVVFGGWHPSLLPEQILRESYADVVVRNQGELTFLEVVRRIESRRSFEALEGCSYRTGNNIRHNADRPIAQLNDLPTPAYDLVDFDAYEQAGGGRKLPYASSVGCPYACSYCTDTVYYGRRFYALSPARVVPEVTSLASRHGLNEVALLDSNFLVDTRRAMEIARGFLESNSDFKWTFQASTDLLCRLSDEQVRLLGRSGVAHIGFGVESASSAVLARMNKHHQRIPDVFEAARKCMQAGIRATFNLIYGFPGETEADRDLTFEIMGTIAHRYENVTFSPNIFTPYPGLPIWPELKRRGLTEPASLKDWSAISLGTIKLPWLAGSAYRNVRRGVSFFMLHDRIARACHGRSLSRFTRSALQELLKPICWRLKHGRFGWPVELWLAKAGSRVVTRRSLLTGQPLESRPAENC